MNDTTNLQLGSIVISKAGRDKTRPFIVLAIEGEYIKIADGDLRKVDKPKLKKLRHVNVTKRLAFEVQTALNEGRLVSDAMLRAAIRDLNIVE